MESDDSQEKYLKHYIQRQEILLLEYIRKNIELELKAISLNASLNEYKSKYEESQKQVEIQNNLMQQAANGVESLTLEKMAFEEKEKKLNETITELKNSLNDCKNERYSITQELNRANEKINNFDNDLKAANYRADEIREEYNRQTHELSELFKECQELKAKLPINKTKAKKETAILPPDEF